MVFTTDLCNNILKIYLIAYLYKVIKIFTTLGDITTVGTDNLMHSYFLTLGVCIYFRKDTFSLYQNHSVL